MRDYWSAETELSGSSEKGPVHLRQITSIQHNIARKFLESWLHVAGTEMADPVAPGSFPLSIFFM